MRNRIGKGNRNVLIPEEDEEDEDEGQVAVTAENVFSMLTLAAQVFAVNITGVQPQPASNK